MSAESLADALVDAYLTSPEIAAQRATIRVAGEAAAQARAGGRVNVTGQVDIELQTNASSDDAFTIPNSLNLTIVQPLYTGGQVENATTAAERRISGAESDLVDVERDILFNAASAFLDVRRDISLVRVARNNVKVLSNQLDAANERFEVGEVTRTDVEQARARLAAARSTLAANQGALENSRDAFRRAVGRDPGKLAPPPPVPDLPKSEDEAVAIALQNDPTLRAARIEREAAGFDVKAAIGSLLPQVDLRGEVNQSNTVFDEFDETRNASVGLRVTIPFYSGGANYAAVRQAQAAADNAAADILTQARDVKQAVGLAWANLRVARAQIRAGQLEVKAAQLAFEGVEEEAKVGARTTLDVLDAEQEVLDARAGLITSQRDEYVAAYQLLQAMGLLTVEHLGLDTGNAPTEADYYETVRNRYFGYDQSDDTVWSLDWRP
ncbi:MAG: TolC family outer membrane protein [Pseudomonadota bacterium]